MAELLLDSDEKLLWELYKIGPNYKRSICAKLRTSNYMIVFLKPTELYVALTTF